ncbi:hypothetical protein WA538_000978, partial [Blastocystis sp. DL]
MDEPRVEDALYFMDEIKRRFSTDNARYNNFLSMMMELKANGIGDGSILTRIQQIFEGHNDLLARFAQFLPPDTGMNLTSQQPIQATVPMPVNPYAAIPQEIANEQEVATRYVSLIKSRFANDKNYTYNQFMSILQDYQSGRKDMRSVIQQIVDLFRGNDDLIQQFVMFLPREFQYEATLLINQMNQPVVQAKPAESFPPTHPPYETGVQAEYVPASRRRPVRVTRPRAAAPAPSRRRHAYEEEEAEEETDTLPPSERRFFERCRREIPSDATYRQFLQLLDLFTKDVFSLSELFTALTDLLHLRHPVINQLRNYLSHKGINEEAMSRSAGLPTWEQIHACPGPTPSYHLLPPQVPRRVGSQRSYAESLVLNDDLVSQTIGSEDFSFNHMRRNQYEDALFRCEDDRFEADVILETTRSAAAQLESLERELQTAPARPLKLRDDALSAVQQAAIRRVYNHNGADVEVLKLLRLDPRGAIPRVLQRLKEKLAQWSEEKVALNERCREVQKANYYLSLDHRSFYFRQSDKKAITTKALVDELKDRVGDPPVSGVCDEGESPLAVAFPDEVVHKQVLRLLLVAAKRQLGRSDVNRVKRLLGELVLSFFRLSPGFLASAEFENQGVQYAVGTHVMTPRGSGVIEAYDGEKKLYLVRVGETSEEFPRKDILIETEEEEEEEEEEETTPAVPPTESVKQVKEEETPIQVENEEEKLADGIDWIFGTTGIYVFYRLYALLYTRILQSKRLCDADLYTEHNMTAHAVERAIDTQREAAEGPSKLQRHIDLMDALIQLLRGELSNQQFEQRCRETVGTSGYMLYTADRVVNACVRHLHAILGDAVATRLVALHAYARQQGGIRPSLYRGNVLRVVGDARTLLFRMEFRRQEEEEAAGELRFWYVGVPHDMLRPAGGVSTEFAEYADAFLQMQETEEEETSSPFLTRSRARARQEARAKQETEDGVDEFIPDGDEEEEVEKKGKKRARQVSSEEEEGSVKKG